jgi:hypothetical protein
MTLSSWSEKRNRLYTRTEISERFWSKVQVRGPDDCWPWLEGTNKKGYGRFQTGRVPLGWGVLLAHRVAFFLTHGKWPSNFATHECDNPPCCNPAHLVDADAKKNAQDMARRGRVRGGARPGEENHASKLLTRQVRLIHEMYRRGSTVQELAERFDVSDTMIRNIVSGRAWRHVT